ncbi:MAG: hypothetical protein U9N35_05195 [Euryarchaeota archaeon]|nr:hypothetical protein [Euryarchaeota archaeon]
MAGLLFVLFSEVSYEIFQEKLDTKSQKYAEEQTGAIKSKLDVTNVDNDKQTFFITIKNGTRYDLVPDAYTNAGSFNSGEIDIDEDNKIADIMVTVKKKDGTSVFSGMVVHGNNNTNATFTGTILQDDIAISRDNQGLIEITISKADMNTGETYSIIITAASTTSTTEYTAI